ncbi:MAG: non-ribosomal peptide synthetase [Gammaproteobacteria bacterium]|jgi:acyl-CoA synthetase (AMP-forming)/AMP-acid ligase II|nr:non-ribosomal peptide synthetase [Gammaproteobacteria bacterium]
MTDFSTLTQALTKKAEERGRITLLAGAAETREIPFDTLFGRARAMLNALQDRGLKPGSELIIHVNDNEQFLYAFWAGILGGVVPVPVAPGISDEHRFKLIRIYRSLTDPWLFTDAGTVKRLESLANEAGAEKLPEAWNRRVVDPAAVDLSGEPGRVYRADAADTAFIQFSSGSTSEPKGVVLSHGNILANIRAIAAGARVRAGDSALSWMPLTHDMGLIGFHLTPLAAGVDHCLMPTDLFVRHPLLWLEKSSELGVSVTCSPNFGLKHLLRALRRHPPETLDLQRIRLIVNGAEPISVDLCEEFLEALAAYGLKRSCMFPVYGLAEASLAVTFPEAETGITTVRVERDSLQDVNGVRIGTMDGPGTLSLVCTGRPVAGCEIRISGASNEPLPERRVGHIQIRGANVTTGYFRNDEANQTAFTPDGWLDTGDLGFTADCGLVVTGRSKEIIFANGQNYYPHDLEAIVERDTGIELGRIVTAAWRADGADSDELLVFLLHKGKVEEITGVARDIHAALSTHTGLETLHIIPVIRIPKTTSGKIQRHLLIDAYRNGDFDEVLARLEALSLVPRAGYEQDLSGIEAQLKAICDEVLEGREVAIEDNLFDIGTSSLELARIHEGIDVAFPETVDVTDLFDHPSIASLSTLLEERLAGSEQPVGES